MEDQLKKTSIQLSPAGHDAAFTPPLPPPLQVKSTCFLSADSRQSILELPLLADRNTYLPAAVLNCGVVSMLCWEVQQATGTGRVIADSPLKSLLFRVTIDGLARPR